MTDILRSRKAPSLLLAALLACTLSARAQPADAAFDAAMAAYERNHWTEAYQRMAALADQGHGRAVRMALDMRRHGRLLYGTDFPADSPRVQAWLRTVDCTPAIEPMACLATTARR